MEEVGVLWEWILQHTVLDEEMAVGNGFYVIYSSFAIEFSLLYHSFDRNAYVFFHGINSFSNTLEDAPRLI